MLKILQARLQQYVNHEFPDVQAGFRKSRGTRDQIANIRWILEKARDFQKNIYFCFIDYAKAFDSVDHNTLWKILKEMGIPDHLTYLLRNLYAGQENIRDTKGTFHGKMGSIKDRNGMDLTEAEDINRWQEYTEELYRKDLHDPDNHDGMITHPEPDILECEVKWALESITMNKASGGDGIPVELSQILKDDAVKVLHSIC